MPYITIKIVGNGAETTEQPSVKGHIWLITDDGNGDPRTYSFGPEVEGTPIEKGYVSSY